MQGMTILESVFRWMHVVAGILWIGLLYFFNWVNSSFAPTMDGDTKKKVVPELLPRALYWFRWGAAWTWFTGVVLLLLVFYHGGILFETGFTWGAPAFVLIAVTFLGVFLYDGIMKSVGKSNMKAAIAICFLLVTGLIFAMKTWGGFGYRGFVIHIGVLFGTTMAFNVWYRIWPAQQKIIRAIKGGEAPDAALVGLAGTRSKHNTYMSLPLVWMMLDTHTIWASGYWYLLPVIIAFAWWVGTMLYKRAGKVKGF